MLARILKRRFAGSLGLLALVVALATQSAHVETPQRGVSLWGVSLLGTPVVANPAPVKDGPEGEQPLSPLPANSMPVESEAIAAADTAVDAPITPPAQGHTPAAPSAAPPPSPMPERSASAEGMRDAPIAAIDDLMRRAIDDGLFPGAAVVVARNGAIVKRQAYGYAALYAGRDQRLESPLPVNNDTIFDIASLTKLFTASAVMKLVEDGAVDVNAPVAQYLPEFAANGKEGITVKHLLTHTGGLPDGVGRPAASDGPQELLQRAFRSRPLFPPDTRRLYSDIDFMVLGALVQRVSSTRLDEFIAGEITGPLGMADTMYLPPATLLPRIAATEELSPRGMVRGAVHDTVAYHMGGVAGHAGLFSTATDLAVFGQMMLNRGEYAGRRILSPDSVAALTSLQVPAAFDNGAGLGWELDQRWYMGGLSSPATFGHTGYTGTSIVVNPQAQVVAVLLTNRVHPLAKTSINAPRRQLADLVASALRS